VRHRATRVVFGDLHELLFRFFVPEGMEQSDSSGERLLHGLDTGDGKVDGAELSLSKVFVMMVIFVIVGCGCEAEQADEQKKSGESFHGVPAEWRRNSSHGRGKRQTRGEPFFSHWLNVLWLNEVRGIPPDFFLIEFVKSLVS
jgi:hypothetical protein